MAEGAHKLRREQKRVGKEVAKGGEKSNCKKREKREYKEGGINQTAVPELHTPCIWRGRVTCTILHHLNVALLIGGASLQLTILLLVGLRFQ